MKHFSSLVYPLTNTNREEIVKKKDIRINKNYIMSIVYYSCYNRMTNSN